MDPRLACVGKRLEGVGRVIAVTGGKGGIGKSLVASTLALTLARQGRSVGLLDLDLTAPCDHVILGFDRRTLEEEFGIEPPRQHGIRFMSVTYFIGDAPAPLRGQDVSNALIELLAITRWGDLDTLVIDMPPGLGDATLDAVRLIDRAEFLVVATGSRVVLETVTRMLRLLKQTRSHILGLVENMAHDGSTAAATLARETGIPFLGQLPNDPSIEPALGNPDHLAATRFARTLATLKL